MGEAVSGVASRFSPLSSSLRAGLVVLLFLAGCSSTSPAQRPSGPGSERLERSGGQPAGSRGTIKTAWLREPVTLAPQFVSGSGGAEIMWVFNSFLTYTDFS